MKKVRFNIILTIIIIVSIIIGIVVNKAFAGEDIPIKDATSGSGWGTGKYCAFGGAANCSFAYKVGTYELSTLYGLVSDNPDPMIETDKSSSWPWVNYSGHTPQLLNKSDAEQKQIFRKMAYLAYYSLSTPSDERETGFYGCHYLYPSGQTSGSRDYFQCWLWQYVYPNGNLIYSPNGTPAYKIADEKAEEWLKENTSTDIRVSYDFYLNYSYTGTLYATSQPGIKFTKISKEQEPNRVELTITKKDKDNENQGLKGAYFILKLESTTDSKAKAYEGQWVKLQENKLANYSKVKYENMFISDNDLNANKGSRANFGSKEKDTVTIKGLPAGKYHIYEVVAPTGYNLSDQDNYSSTNNWVDCGSYEITLDSTNEKSITIYNKKTRANLQIQKVDSEGKELKLSGIEFKLKLIEATDIKNLQNKWVTTKNTPGSSDTFDYSNVTDGKYDYSNYDYDSFLTDESNLGSAGIFVTNADGKINITGLLNGRYEVYETKSANGYDLEGQEGYGKDTNYSKWVDCGEAIVNETTNEAVPYNVKNIKTRGNLDIEKRDSRYKDLMLAGAEFKLKLVEATDNKNLQNKWVITKNVSESSDTFDYSNVTDGKYDYSNYDYDSFLTDESNLESAGIFVTNAEGKINITGLLNGKYHIYETKTPKGYDITKQERYGKDTNYPEWVDLGEIFINNEYDENGIVRYPTYTFENDKIVDKIEGHVWLDGPDTNKVDTVYNGLRFTYSDKAIDPGITVNLKDENGKIINSSVTDGEGYWHIDKRSNGEEFNYWDLVNAYVEFVYDNKKYVCVDPFVSGGVADVTDDNGNTVKSVVANSKAQEYSLSKEELDDTNLTGTEGAYPGLAVTKQNANKEKTPQEVIGATWDNPNYKLEELGLTGYYNIENYTVENINLGLWEKIEPTYDISQSLQYSKAQINGYTYTYDYNDGKNGLIESNMVPATYRQIGAKTYGAKVYPSDIAYTTEQNPNGMEMYVVYKITVSNTTATSIPYIYDEIRLYLTSLTDTFDQDRYELSRST